MGALAWFLWSSEMVWFDSAVQRPLTWEGRGEWCPLLPPLHYSLLATFPLPHLPPSALCPECLPHRHCPELNVPLWGRERGRVHP